MADLGEDRVVANEGELKRLHQSWCDDVLKQAVAKVATLPPRPAVDIDDEPLLRVDKGRFLLTPIKHQSIWDFCEKSEKMFWTAHEVKLGNDHFDKLERPMQIFLEEILVFFAVADGIVQENLANAFNVVVQLPEARKFYATQIRMESIHAHMYALFIETYIKDSVKRQTLLEKADKSSNIARKNAWAQSWIGDTEKDEKGRKVLRGSRPGTGFAEALVAFAAVEGIFFSGSFSAIEFLKLLGLMPGLGQGNDLIKQDEAMHHDFACHLYVHYVKNKLPTEVVHGIIAEAVMIECDFWDEAMAVPLAGMNKYMMKQYVHYIADRTLKMLGVDPLGSGKHFNPQNPNENPHPHMKHFGADKSTDFFAHTPAEYQKLSLIHI